MVLDCTFILGYRLAPPEFKSSIVHYVSKGEFLYTFNVKLNLGFKILYPIDLKGEMAEDALADIPTDSDNREQARQLWANWLGWSASSPAKRRTLAQLGVSDDITQESRQTAKHTMADMTEILERSRENGPMCDVPRALFIAMASALADAAIDFMIADPANADKHCMSAFEAFWRMIG